MTTITITANDSSSAMDQIVQKLGPEALIISTKNRGGKVEIKATNEAMADLRKPKVETETGDFSDLIRRRMPRIGNSGRRAVQKFGKRRAINTDSLEKISAVNDVYGEEVHDIKSQLNSLRSMLSGMVITDTSGLNDNLGQSSAVQLRQANFSQAIVSELEPVYTGLPFEEGRVAFMRALAKRLVALETPQALGSHIIFVVGSTGSGKSSLAAKLAARALDKDSSDKIDLLSLQSSLQISSGLRSYARLLNLSFSSLNCKQFLMSLANFKRKLIVEVSCDHEEFLAAFEKAKEAVGVRRVQVVLSLSGGSSEGLINRVLSDYGNLEPIIALTKLDECETAPQEFSKIAEWNAKIGLFTGTNSILNALATASEDVLAQYLKENC